MAQSRYWRCMSPRVPTPRKDVIGPTFPLDEILNRHRAELLFATRNMIQVPLPVQEPCLSGGQLVLSVMSNPTHFIMFVHEPPEVRAAVDPITCKVIAESSYVVDVSQDVLLWLKSSGIAFADITVPLKPAKIRHCNVHVGQLYFPGEPSTRHSHRSRPGLRHDNGFVGSAKYKHPAKCPRGCTNRS